MPRATTEKQERRAAKLQARKDDKKLFQALRRTMAVNPTPE